MTRQSVGTWLANADPDINDPSLLAWLSSSPAQVH
jgi:hypothetical protein